jgi:hypothetical protein
VNGEKSIRHAGRFIVVGFANETSENLGIMMMHMESSKENHNDAA